MHSLRKVLILFCAAFLASNSHGLEKKSPLALFKKCYAHLTQKYLPADHLLRPRVESGEVTPAKACLMVLESAMLKPEGNDEGQLIRDTLESRAVLRTMNDHHRNWFASEDLVLATPRCPEKCVRADMFHDGQEPALHLTRLLFTEALDFTELVTGVSGMEALRTGGPKENTSQEPTYIFQSNNVTAGLDPSPFPIDGELVQKGALLGVRRISLNSRKHDTIAKSNFKSIFPKTMYVHRAMGGGVIGSISYLLLNLGRPMPETSDGGIVMSRRWAKAIYRDLLCRDVPVIRISDAMLYVNPKPTSATPPFRKSANCMQCHASMDPLAAASRNITYALSPWMDITPTASPTTSTPQIYQFDPVLPREPGQVDLDRDFYLRPPHGALLYRDYKGDLINIPVKGLTELGETLTKLDDLYHCAASRYFQHFTGVNVSLDDPRMGGNLSEKQKKYRDFVISLGQRLKEHQNLRQLVQEILESDVYRRGD